MQDNKPYERLCGELVGKFGATMESPSDFNRLSLTINVDIGESVSASTLKRLFGYVKSETDISKSTLSILTRWLGYKGWGDFCATPASQSQFIKGATLKTEQLTPGDKVRFLWSPDRHCVARYLGDYRFVVEEVQHAKLKIGDTFKILQFTDGSAAYFTDVCPPGGTYGNGRSYVAGYRTGITDIEVIHVRQR